MTSSLHTLIQDTLLYATEISREERSFLVPKEYAQKISLTVAPSIQAPAESVSCLSIEVLPPISSPIVTHNSPSPTRITPPQQTIVKPSPEKRPSAPLQMRDTLSKLIPSLRLTEAIPDDGEGQRMANVWKEKLSDTNIVLLALSQDNETLELLKSLAKAIDSRFGQTKIISAKRLESQEQWDLFFKANTFRLVIASASHPCLINGMQTVGTTPLLLLEAPQVYKQIAHKAELWKSICHYLSE